MNNKEEHVKIKCLSCGDIIIGDGKGTYIECNCGKCAVDETKYYCRIIGNQKDWEQIEEESKEVEE